MEKLLLHIYESSKSMRETNVESLNKYLLGDKMQDLSMITDVSFITTEEGEDLIVAFAIPVSDQGDVISLILLRTSKYESLLDEHERGVNVSYENQVDTEDDLLEKIEIQENVVKITTKRNRYKLNISRVDEDEIKEAKKILKKMNFDQRFVLSII